MLVHMYLASISSVVSGTNYVLPLFFTLMLLPNLHLLNNYLYCYPTPLLVSWKLYILALMT